MNLADTLAASAQEAGMREVDGKSQIDHELEKPTADGLAGVLAANQGQTPEQRLQKEIAAEVLIKVGTPLTLGKVKTWSFSSLKNFERCPQAVKFQYVDGKKQESGEAAIRGSLIHDQCELWVRGETDVLPHDKKTKFDVLKNHFNALKASYDEGKVTLEENWGFRQDWSPCDWASYDSDEVSDPELWGKAKLDAFVLESEDSCRIIDYKTGRAYGNEFAHKDQGITYALAAMHRYPEINTFHVEFWYIDDGRIMATTYPRSRLNILLQKYHTRAARMTTETEFPAKSTAHACQWCAYGCNTNKAGKHYGDSSCQQDFYRGDDDV